MRRTLLLVSIVTSTFAGLLFLFSSLASTIPAAADSISSPSAATFRPVALQDQPEPSDPAAPDAITMVEPRVLLRKNSLYYGAQNVSIAEINSILISSDEAWDRYRAGEFDTITPPETALPAIKGSATYGPQLNNYATESVYFVGFSTDIPPFDDANLRAAFASAIDRPRLINEALSGDETPALTLTPPGSFGHVDGYAAGIGHPYDPVAARDYLSLSRYAGQPVSMTVNTGRLPQALSLQQMWFETLNISVTVNAIDWASYIDLINNGTQSERPHIFTIGWGADYPDANNFHDGIFVSGSNWPRYNNGQYVEIVLTAGSELNSNTRLGLYAQAESWLVMTDTAIAPLFYGAGHRLTRPDLNRTYRGYGAQHFDEWSFMPGAERSLVRADGITPQTLDPSRVSNISEMDYVEQLFLGLTDVDPKTGQAVLELATGYEVSPDGLSYTFTMRSDAVWTDGTPVTAFDVEFGVLRSLSPTFGYDSYPASLLYIIRNAEWYQLGQIIDPAQVGVQALDARRVRFDLERPAPYFPIIAGLPPARPQPQQVVQQYGPDWTRSDNIVTNGPYRLASFNTNSADVGVIKLDSGDPVQVNEPMTYTLIVYNNGPLTATSVSLVDLLPIGATLVDQSWSPGCSPDGPIYCFWNLIAPGDFVVASFSVIPNVVGTIYNQASVSAFQFDDNGANNQQVEQTSVVEVVSTAPVLRSISPRYGKNTEVTPVEITGMNFKPGIRLRLVNGKTIIPLVPSFQSAELLSTTIPAGLRPDAYNLLAINLNGEQDVLPEAFIVVEPVAPTLFAVRPSSGPNDKPVIIDIYGRNFVPDIRAYLQSSAQTTAAPAIIIPLESLLYVDSGHLRAVVPRNSPPGIYGLTVINPGGTYDQLFPAYEVLDASKFDDLFAEPSNLWLRPATLRIGEPALMGLVVHRRSPEDAGDLNVRVQFGIGEPGAGGVIIGASNALVPANGSASTAPIFWTPTEIGPKTLCAKIDPANNIAEVDEGNNLVCRPVRVLPQLPDTTAPEIISFTVNDGARLTTDPFVSLDVVATDDTSLNWVLYVEYTLNQGGYWDQVANSGWLPYETSTVDYPWQLFPQPGIHYFRACVADASGNVGCAAGLRPIAYRPDSSFLVEGEVHVYRRLLTPGFYEVQLTIFSGGMADLYVWDADWQNGWVTAMTDVVSFQSAQFSVASQGLYQFEVEATQGNVQYRLDLVPVSIVLPFPMLSAMPSAPSSPVARFTPFVNPDDTPTEEESGLPSAPTGTELYLPVVLRE